LYAAKVGKSNFNSTPVAIKRPNVAYSKEKEGPNGKDSGGTY